MGTYPDKPIPKPGQPPPDEPVESEMKLSAWIVNNTLGRLFAWLFGSNTM